MQYKKGIDFVIISYTLPDLAKQCVKSIETFFKNEAVLNGCRGLEIIGRNGWEKVIDNMPSLDFQAKGVFYEMDT